MRQIRLVLCAALIALAALLTACREDLPERLTYGFGADSRNPVYLLEGHINGASLPYGALSLVWGGLDGYPRSDRVSYVNFTSLPEAFPIELLWIEVTSGRAYFAQTTIHSKDLALSAGGGSGPLDILILPGGRLVIGSDPLPEDGKLVLRDIAKTCGTRQPQQDRDIAKEADAIGGMKEMLERLKDPLIEAPCGGEKE